MALLPESKLKRYERMRHTLEIDRARWIPAWRDLSDYLLPWRSRFVTTDRNQGQQRNGNIIDPEGSLSLRTMKSGMMSGITSPARPWFRLAHPDAKLNELAPVKRWLSTVEQIIRDTLVKSNIYKVLPTMYGDLGCFGTAVALVEEDDEDVLRGYSLPIGSYSLSASKRGVVDTCVRVFSKTVRQIVDEFGEDNLSTRVQSLIDKGQTEEWIDVVHVIEPNADHDPGAISAKYKKFSSCYYELGAKEDQFLRESGYNEFPLMAARWDTTGEDVYGNCPGMDALGDVKALQMLQRRKAQAIEKTVNPPLTAPSHLKGLNAVPGGVTLVDLREGQQSIRPLYEVRFDIAGVLEDIREHEQRISRTFFADLWRLISDSDRRQVTAEEIRAKEQEKLLQLGPVLESVHDEMLDPLIDRTFWIVARRGMLPTPPPELQGAKLHVQYISIVAQAQRSVGMANVDRLLLTVNSMAAVRPDVLDKVNFDEVVDDYADKLGVPPNLILSNDEVAVVRQNRQAQQQAAAKLQAAQQAADTAQTLSKTNMEGDNALTRLAASGSLPGASP